MFPKCDFLQLYMAVDNLKANKFGYNSQILRAVSVVDNKAVESIKFDNPTFYQLKQKHANIAQAIKGKFFRAVIMNEKRKFGDNEYYPIEIAPVNPAAIKLYNLEVPQGPVAQFTIPDVM